MTDFEQQQIEIGNEVAAMVDAMPTASWLRVWSIGPMGDCACPRRFACPRIGKHPHLSFEHGVLSAVATRAETMSTAATSNRLAVVPGEDLIVLDIDTDRAWRGYVRHIADYTSPVAVSRSVRGWHIYLPCEVGGWSMGSLGTWMKNWMQRSDLHGIQYRTGLRNYVVWPQGLDGRHWVPLEDFAARVEADTPYPVQRAVLGPDGAPWGEVNPDTARSVQARHSVDSDVPEPYEVNALDQQSTLDRLEIACQRLAEAPDGTKNNTLNAVAYYQGAEAVWAGWDEAMVRQMLADAYWPDRPVDSGGQATITSGLRSGTARLMRAVRG